MAEILITGAAGFVGNNLARHLLNSGHEVNLLLREDYAQWRIKGISDHVRICALDLCDSERLNQVVRRVRPEWIFHLAAHGQYSYQTDAEKILQTNLIGTANLVRACLGVGFEVFVNTGSSSEYGLKDHAPAETEFLEPNSFYAVTKASATLFCSYTARISGLRIPTLRLYSVYGPYEEPSRLMPTLILHGLENKLPPLVDPDIARDFIYVDDVVQAYVLAATLRDQEVDAVYNVGTGVQTTLRHVVEITHQVLNITNEPVWGSMPNRTWDTSTWVANSNRIREALGWKPMYSFEQGFSRMVEWFRSGPEVIKTYKNIANHCIPE
ncbi:MAG: NAD-dependent epimerase/dehydratase family protein [Desulfomonile sp.]|nr:NAD-dependent epimerase/dehydratase family protein [Deltaproteobacteria bacterium]